MKSIEMMGKFTAIGMRRKVEDEHALVINTCSDNDTKEVGDLTHWSWSNPTSRLFYAEHSNDPICKAVSTECLWQGTKMKAGQRFPDVHTLNGDWRRGKGKKPIGAWNGPMIPLITTPGEARTTIYIPAFRNQIEGCIETLDGVQKMVNEARGWDGPVFLRDHDTGRGVQRNGPMSHAWLLAMWLNSGEWPTA